MSQFSLTTRMLNEILFATLSNPNITDILNLLSLVELLKNENGHVGNLKITGKLIEVPHQTEATVIGDIHGDFEMLTQILENCDFARKVRHDENPLLTFLGDYGDRGELSPEVYYVVLKLKEAYPKNVVLMRGNHEGPEDLLASPHDMPTYLQSKFGEEWPKAYAKLRELWNHGFVSIWAGYFGFLGWNWPTEGDTE
jgi:protein phosphatase